jgi:hypothetical protein
MPADKRIQAGQTKADGLLQTAHVILSIRGDCILVVIGQHK